MKIKTSAKLIAKRFVPLIEVADEELVILFMETGNKEAFEMIYYRYRKKVYNFVLALTKNKAASEELAHDSFIKVYNKIELYKEGHKFSSWFWTIVRNTVYDYFKKRDALNYLAAVDEESSVEELYIHEEDPESLAMKKAQAQDIKDCFSELNPYQKEILSLKTYSELSYEEIKDCVEGTISSVKSALNRAKKSMTRCLEGKMNG